MSENAEYDAAKERQGGMIEARIAELEGKIGRFHIIDTKTLSGNKVVFGATVVIENIDTEEQKKHIKS